MMSKGKWRSLAAGFVLAVVACGGVVAERLSRGDMRIALAAHVILTIAVIAMVKTERRTPAGVALGSSTFAVQLVGAAAGIVLVHCVLRSIWLGVLPWLSERPGQLVNDAVAVVAPLALVRASCRRPPSTPIFLSTFAFVTVYRLTACFWHFDAGHFTCTIQDLVTAEIAGSALGIATFKLLVAT